MNDNYTHSDMNIIYIVESIPGPAENSEEYDTIINNYNSQMLESCSCVEFCAKTLKILCTCLKTSFGNNYINGKLRYRLNYKSNVDTDYPIFECNSNCSCPATCGNRIVQKGPIEGLIVKVCDNNHKGLGLFSSYFIHKGTFICEYAGELITKSQALQRSKENEVQRRMNYIFCLNEHTHDNVIQTFVDPSKFGNIGRYINHSCEPNCCIVPVRCDIAIPKLAIFAFVDILPGEEITFSYSSGSNRSIPDIKTDAKRKICLCHTESCKGIMPCENF